MSTQLYVTSVEEMQAAKRQATQVHDGLKGVTVGETRLSQVDGEHGKLCYRGIDVGTLAEKSTFEETIYLLWWDALPTAEQLATFSAELAERRALAPDIHRLLQVLPGAAEPMDALRTAVSALTCTVDDDGDRCHEASVKTAMALTAKLPTITTAYYHYLNDEESIPPDPTLGHAANFLYMLHGERPTEMESCAMDVAMLLMADHGFNASTFAARVTSSTLADLYAAITTAIGTLSGPLHGGANRRAMEMLLAIGSADKAEAYLTSALAEGQRIMGFGHRVYRHVADPRSHTLRRMLYKLCEQHQRMDLYELAGAVADLMATKKSLYPNVDFYTAPILYLLRVPLTLFTPVFAISRIPGWTAQVMEQYANNRLLRPLARYVGAEHRAYIPLDRRRA
ncbi:MAG: citrate synthase [Chloroflexi bacterium]|jgi:citrate synthase|nr:citrate synthase [Chloroflexota bacterium]